MTNDDLRQHAPKNNPFLAYGYCKSERALRGKPGTGVSYAGKNNPSAQKITEIVRFPRSGGRQPLPDQADLAQHEASRQMISTAAQSRLYQGHPQRVPAAVSACPELKMMPPQSGWKRYYQSLMPWMLVAGAIFLLSVPLSSQQQRFHFHWPESSKVTLETQKKLGKPVLNGLLTSCFGRRWGRPHQGVDIAVPSGTPIYAAASGKVVYRGWEMGYGKSVVIDHGAGLKTRYAHCSRLRTPLGKWVLKGEKIAEVGSTGHATGPHLHFEVLVNNIRKNPLTFFSLDYPVGRLRKPQGPPIMKAQL